MPLSAPSAGRPVDFNEDDFEEYNPHPYLGGYDIALAYGHPLPPSSATCYPISSSASLPQSSQPPPPLTLPRLPSTMVCRRTTNRSPSRRQTCSGAGPTPPGRTARSTMVMPKPAGAGTAGGGRWITSSATRKGTARGASASTVTGFPSMPTGSWAGLSPSW
ncbi:unnamed protein product [Musa textilis]